MPRNGSGTYSIPLTFTPHTDADAADVNQNFSDIGTALTGSVAADGQTVITGQMKGVVSATPCWSFNGDLDTGFGSDAANEAFVKCGGTEISRHSAAGLDVTSGHILHKGYKLVPTGAMMDYIGAAAPGGWVLGDGGSIGNASSGATERANADTQELFELIWNSANVANGEGQVQDSSGSNVARGASAAADYAANRRILLPDFRDRVARGKGAGTSLGETGGADSVTLTAGNIPQFSISGSVSVTDGTGNADNIVRFVGGLDNVTAPGGPPAVNALNWGTHERVAITASFTGNPIGSTSPSAVDIKPKSIVQTKIVKL